MNKFFTSFKHAFNGISQLIKTERNFKIHLVCLVLVVSLGLYFKISSLEWLLIFLISALVLSLEAINSAIEKLCDLYSTEQNPKIKVIKDISAGAVLIAAIFAIFIGVAIFWKYFK